MTEARQDPIGQGLRRESGGDDDPPDGELGAEVEQDRQPDGKPEASRDD